MQRPRRESVLATVLFTDIVRSSELAADVGDRRWRVLLSRHHALVRRELRRFGGKELDTAGDGFFASFDNPGNAVRCAAALVAAVQDLGIDIRTGLHLGQAEIVGRKLGGVAVHIGARTMAQAGPAEVLVTSGLKDVLPPADFRFEDRGTHALKGVPGEWRLYRLTSLDKPLPGPLDPEVAASRRAAVQAPPMWRRRYLLPVAAVAAVLVTVVVVTIALSSSGSPIASPSGPSPTGLPAHALLKLDPATGEVKAVLAIGDPHPLPPRAPGGQPGVGPGPHSLAVGEGSIWITNGGDDSVVRVDPLSLKAQTIEVPGRPNDIIVAQGTTWVTSSRGELTNIDPGTNLTATMDISAQAPQPVGVGTDEGGLVYVTTFTPLCNTCTGFARLIAVNPATGSTRSLRTPNHISTSALVVIGGRVWVTADGEVWRVDPATGDVLRVPVGGTLGDMVADPRSHSLWVTKVDSAGLVGSAVQIDTATGEIVGGQPVGCCPGSIAIGDGYVWVTNPQEGTIQRISLVTGDVAPPIDVGKGVDGVAVGLGDVWVTIDSPE
jgi:class 3 adenylate cyclase/streptogramin lyase